MGRRPRDGIGPNLFLTGSVATVICRRIAREGGADLDPLRFTLVGLALVPLQLAAGAVGLLASGALHHV
jgi:Na+/H+ antiporter NhaD/arsenite permease-like protein